MIASPAFTLTVPNCASLPNSMSQALALVADLKLGLYCKIKPKAMFLCQSYGTALGAIVNYSERQRPDLPKNDF